MRENERIIREFVNAWARLDASELANYFSEDGIYNNIPLHPVTGKREIEDFIRNFTANWTETSWDIIHVVAEGDMVITERVDRTRAEGGKSVDLPVVGIFEMEDGKIKNWREYFDLDTYLKALG